MLLSMRVGSVDVRAVAPRFRAAMTLHEMVEAYELLIDREDGSIAAQRLADLNAGRSQVVSADEVARDLGL